MRLFQTTYLLFSLLVVWTGCSSDYKALKATHVDRACLGKIKAPALATSWYTASVDVVGKHISGLLLIKEMPEASKRIVFTNEAGVTFFDFGFNSNGEFKVFSVISQLNKKVVINFLKEDFTLLLGIPFKDPAWQSSVMNEERYFGITGPKGNYYVVTGQDCAAFKRLEYGSDRKRKLSINLYGLNLQTPDSIALQHHTFAMKINLKKLSKS